MKNLIIKLISFQWQSQDSAMEVRGIWAWGQKYPQQGPNAEPHWDLGAKLSGARDSRRK